MADTDRRPVRILILINQVTCALIADMHLVPVRNRYTDCNIHQIQDVKLYSSLI